MDRHGDRLLLSASDLVGHLNCGHLTELDIAVVNGAFAKPTNRDPLLELLWARGAQHEQDFVEHLRVQGFDVTVIEGVGVQDDAIALTLDAMRRGDPVIVQGAFRLNGWVGRTDVLQRIEAPSNLGAWSYEVIDTKLARETKAGRRTRNPCPVHDTVHSTPLEEAEKHAVPISANFGCANSNVVRFIPEAAAAR